LEARIISQQIEHRIEPEHEPHVITATGKAFYDIGHAPADHSNRKSAPKGYAVWEIHPVMKMEVIPRSTEKSSRIGYTQRAGLTASPNISPSTDLFSASMHTAMENDSSLRPMIC
jgi:hypothetical protein